MKKYVTICKVAITLIIVVIAILCISYNYGISPVSKNDKNVEIVIENNSTYLTISKLLKENNLIKSETFYKVYIKIFKPNNLQAGTYILNENMGVKKIVEKLESNEATIDTIQITIPEGKNITDVATIISNSTNYTKEELLNYWQDNKLIDSLIQKYWFIKDDVKDDKIRYALEGYFFPDTYLIATSSTKEEITYKMLDRMDEILSKYKDKINNSEYTIHEILTLASIVEHEAILDIDRPKIARVFLNRLDIDMMLQSCATIGYAIGEWKLTYTSKDLQTPSPYNTYMNYGLPIGPGDMPGEASIVAVLNPDDNDYLYFLANVYSETDNNTYYSSSYKEHQNKCIQYLGKTC